MFLFFCILYSIAHPLSPYPRTKAFTSKTSEHTQTQCVGRVSRRGNVHACASVHACACSRVAAYKGDKCLCVDTHSFKVDRLPLPLPSFFLR